MNYYNPYFTMAPFASAAPASRGLLSGLASRGFSFSNIISGTQKTLGLINQAIPVIKQVSPVVKNAKTMFRVMNEFKKVDTPVASKTNPTPTQNYEFIDSEKKETIQQGNETGPTFFI